MSCGSDTLTTLGRVAVVNDTHQSVPGLVDVAAERHDASGRRLALMAPEYGFKVSVATTEAIRKGRYLSTPTDDTLRAIAWPAGVLEGMAFTAAGQTVSSPPLGEELPPGADNLPPKTRKDVIEYTRFLIEQQEESGNSHSNLQQHGRPASAAWEGLLLARTLALVRRR